jgi:prevent-host-death family protein
MPTISLREANQQLSRYAALAEAGEEFIVTRRGLPAFRIAPLARETLTPQQREALIQEALGMQFVPMDPGGGSQP